MTTKNIVRVLSVGTILFNGYLLYGFMVDSRWDPGHHIPNVELRSMDGSSRQMYQLSGSILLLFRATDNQEPALSNLLNSPQWKRVRIICLDRPVCRPEVATREVNPEDVLFDVHHTLQNDLGHFHTPVVAVVSSQGRVLCGVTGARRQTKFGSAVQECSAKAAQ